MPPCQETEQRPPQPSTLESAYGSVQPSAHPEDFDQLVRDAKDAKAERTVRELRESQPAQGTEGSYVSPMCPSSSNRRYSASLKPSNSL